MLKKLIEEKRLVICVGSGGVGKTTVSAAIALAAAIRGKKSLVVTIDPAKRLADALGFEEVAESETEIPMPHDVSEHFLPHGRLFGLMLDQKHTFDRIVDRYSPSVGDAKRLKSNPWYKQMSEVLAGAQDYMAVEKLYEMARERNYDFIVLDTPPTSNALDFIDAPRRLTALLTFQPLQWLQKTMDGSGKTGRVLRWGSSSLLRGIGRVTGKEVVEDMMQLMQDLSGLYSGLNQRAEEIDALMRSNESAFFLVTTPERQSLLEAIFFRQKLIKNDMPFAGFWVNRMKGFYRFESEWRNFFHTLHDFSSSELEDIEQRFSSVLATESLSDIIQETSTLFHDEAYRTRRAIQEVDFLTSQVDQKTFIGLLPTMCKDMNDVQGLLGLSHLLLENGLKVRS